MNKKQKEILENRLSVVKWQLGSKYFFLAVWIMLTLFVSWLFAIMILFNSMSTNKIHKEKQEIDYKLAGGKN